MDRRHFFEVLAAGLTAGFMGSARPSMAGPLRMPVEQDEEGLTPLARFFVTAIVSVPPRIDGEKDRLRIDGAVEQPAHISYGELAQMPQQVQESVLQCVGGARGRARWEGVGLRYLLERAGRLPGVKKVVFYGADGYESSIPLATALRPDSLLALVMNGEPLWPKHGWPVRLVLPGKYGYKQVKWLTRIELVTRHHKGYWEQRGYSDDGTMAS
jgi:DMSO/TMAO reductase YedYZ molybdopterin-dependent catalytic subunit